MTVSTGNYMVLDSSFCIIRWLVWQLQLKRRSDFENHSSQMFLNKVQRTETRGVLLHSLCKDYICTLAASLGAPMMIAYKVLGNYLMFLLAESKDDCQHRELSYIYKLFVNHQ